MSLHPNRRGKLAYAMDVEALAHEAKQTTSEQFVARYPHLFLLYYEGKDEGSQAQFFTEAPPYPPQKWKFSGVMQLLPVVKAPQNPFPERISIGRARNCDVVLRHPSVSKLHAHIRAEKGRWLLVDNDSHNGTSVGTTPVTSATPTELRSGDLLTFGAFTVRVIDGAELHAVLRRMMDQ